MSAWNSRYSAQTVPGWQLGEESVASELVALGLEGLIHTQGLDAEAALTQFLPITEVVVCIIHTVLRVKSCQSAFLSAPTEIRLFFPTACKMYLKTGAGGVAHARELVPPRIESGKGREVDVGNFLTTVTIQLLPE
jgi:hypothetical protein